MAKALSDLSLADNLSKHLECAVCLEQYTEPKVLPCLHTFCKRCLQGLGMLQEGTLWKINCPTCGSCVQIPQGKIDMLQDNFFVNNLVSTVALHQDSGKSGLECDNCTSGDSPVSRCCTCSHFLCEFCTQAHRRGRTTSFHDLTSLDEAKKMGSTGLTKPFICKEHEGGVKLFCETCEEGICRDCTIVRHRNHKYAFVQDVFSKGKESLLNTLSETETKLLILKEALDGVLEMKRNVHICAEQTMQEVVDCFDEIMATLDARRGELVASVEELKKTKLKSLEIQQEELETAVGSVQSSMEFTKTALESGNEVEILNLHKQMSRQLQDLNSSKLQLQPSVDYGLKFKSDNLLKFELASFGVVTDIVTCAAMSTLTMGNGQEGVMYNTMCGQPIEFTVTAKERNGKKRLDGGDNVLAVTDLRDAEDTCPELMAVNDCGDGTYNFSYTPTEEGDFELSVGLNGCPVQGSPFTWFVMKWNLKMPLSSPNREGRLHLSDEGLTAEYIPQIMLSGSRVQQINTQPTLQSSSRMYNPQFGTMHDFRPCPVAHTVGVQRINTQSTLQSSSRMYHPKSGTKNDLRPCPVAHTFGVPFGQHVGSFDAPGLPQHPDTNGRPFVECSLALPCCRHVWKAQVFGNILQGFRFGVSSCGSDDAPGQPRKWWVWGSGQLVYEVANGQTAKRTGSTITDCASGDIIEMYLDCEDGTLKIYNPRTEESDTLHGVERGVLPVFCMDSKGHKVSLRI